MPRDSEYHTYPAICYATDHDTAVLKNRWLRDRGGNIYESKVRSNGDADYYAYYPEVPVCVWVRTGKDMERFEVPTLEKQLDALRAKIRRVERISNLDVKFIELTAPELLNRAKIARSEWLAKQAEEESKILAQRQAAWQQEVKEVIEESNAAVEKALSIIRGGGRMENVSVKTYDEAEDEIVAEPVLLILLERYGIKVPPRTAGWIKTGLGEVKFEDGKAVSTRAYVGHDHSTTVFDYLDKLTEAIAKEANNNG